MEIEMLEIEDERHSMLKHPKTRNSSYSKKTIILVLALITALLLTFCAIFSFQKDHAIASEKTLEAKIMKSKKQLQARLSMLPQLLMKQGESHGTAYLIIASGDNVNNAQDGSLAWSHRMSNHLKSKLFADFKEIGFVKLLEGAPADKIRKWEWGMVYSKNLIDKRVTEYFEDYPSNDDYSLNLLNSEYPFKDLNIASFSVEQANEYLDEAIARAVNALKDTVPIWREIKQ
uniref:Uncharacterized protein n=2 Tax=Ditylenchus dipsaci TaxID=166011 RepID=A0A915E0X2_9BILA